jgi:hypothetical protein
MSLLRARLRLMLSQHSSFPSLIIISPTLSLSLIARAIAAIPLFPAPSSQIRFSLKRYEFLIKKLANVFSAGQTLTFPVLSTSF